MDSGLVQMPASEEAGDGWSSFEPQSKPLWSTAQVAPAQLEPLLADGLHSARHTSMQAVQPYTSLGAVPSLASQRSAPHMTSDPSTLLPPPPPMHHGPENACPARNELMTSPAVSAMLLTEDMQQQTHQQGALDGGGSMAGGMLRNSMLLSPSLSAAHSQGQIQADASSSTTLAALVAPVPAMRKTRGPHAPAESVPSSTLAGSLLLSPPPMQQHRPESVFSEQLEHDYKSTTGWLDTSSLQQPALRISPYAGQAQSQTSQQGSAHSVMPPGFPSPQVTHGAALAVTASDAQAAQDLPSATSTAPIATSAAAVTRTTNAAPAWPSNLTVVPHGIADEPHSRQFGSQLSEVGMRL